MCDYRCVYSAIDLVFDQHYYGIVLHDELASFAYKNWAKCCCYAATPVPLIQRSLQRPIPRLCPLLACLPLVSISLDWLRRNNPPSSPTTTTKHSTSLAYRIHQEIHHTTTLLFSSTTTHQQKWYVNKPLVQPITKTLQRPFRVCNHRTATRPAQTQIVKQRACQHQQPFSFSPSAAFNYRAKPQRSTCTPRNIQPQKH